MNKFHKNFQLNGYAFSSEEELFTYAKKTSESVCLFLEQWLSSEEFIAVKTSGSTGKPKSILLKKEFMVNSAKATGAFFNLKEGTSALLCLSVDYIAGKMMLVRSLTLGWRIDIVKPISNPLDSIEKEYDFSAMVPLQLQNSLTNIHKVKKLIVGGGVVSKALQKQIEKVKTKIYATYGMTETITHIAVKKLNNFSVTSNKLERLFYETLPNITIYKDQRNCLLIKAPKISEEFIISNDVIELISDTKFQWLGRSDNVINSGGVKLHPETIEEKLAIMITQRFFVAGVKDVVLGEKLILIIEGGEKKYDLSKIKNLTKYEKPKEVYFIPKFIETKTKKIQRLKTLNLLIY